MQIRAGRGGERRRQPGSEQRADQPAEHVAAAGRGQPWRTGRVQVRQAVRVRDHRRVALEQHDGAPSSAAARRAAAEPVGAHVARDARELAVVRGEHGAAPRGTARSSGRRASTRQRVGVHDHRDVRGQHVGEQRQRRPRRCPCPGRPSRPAPAARPGRAPSLHHHLRVAGADRLGGAARVAHHSGAAADRRAGGQHAGTGVGGRAGDHPDDAARVLVVGRRRAAGSSAAHVAGLQHERRGGRAARARCRRAGPRRPARHRRRTSRPGFSAPNVTVTSARTACSPASPVSASTPDGTSTATVSAILRRRRRARRPRRAVRRGRRCRQSRRRRGRRRASGAGSASTIRPPAPRSAASPPGVCAARLEQQRADTCAPRRASRAPAYSASPPLLPRRRAARRARRRPRRAARRTSSASACRGPLHQRAVRQPWPSAPLRRPGSARPCTRRACTLRPPRSRWPTAMPPSCDSETCQRVDAERGGARRDRPGDRRATGGPRRRRITSASGPAHAAAGARAPWPAPPWPRTARPATRPMRGTPAAVTSSAGVNSRAASAGVRASASANRATGTTSIPTPTIMGPRSGDAAARRAGRVVGQVPGERRHVRVEVGRGVVDRGRDLAEPGGDQLHLAVVVDDVAGRVDARRRRAPHRVDHDAAAWRCRCPTPVSGPRLAVKPSAATSLSQGRRLQLARHVDVDLGDVRVAAHVRDLRVGQHRDRRRLEQFHRVRVRAELRAPVHDRHRLGDRFEHQRPVDAPSRRRRRPRRAGRRKLVGSGTKCTRPRPRYSPPAGSGRGVNVPIPPVITIARHSMRTPGRGGHREAAASPRSSADGLLAEQVLRD